MVPKVCVSVTRSDISGFVRRTTVATTEEIALNIYLSLFHNLVDGGTIDVGHFVEFINADNSAVGKDHGTGLQATLARLGVSGDGSCKTDTGGSSAGSSHGTGSRKEDIAKELRFGHAGISNQEDVDVSTKSCSVGKILFQTTEEHAQQGPLDVLVPMDRWSQRFGQQLEHVDRLHAREFLAFAHIFGSDEDGRLLAQMNNVAGQQDGLEGSRRESALLTRQRSEGADDLDTIAGFAPVHQVVITNDIYGSRQLT